MRTFLITLALTICSIAPADDRIATKPVDRLTKNPAAEMVAGIDQFLLRKWDEADHNRSKYWKTRDQLNANRSLLVEMLGLEKARHSPSDGLIRDLNAAALTDKFAVHRVRWPVLSDPAPQTNRSVGLWGEGLYLAPTKTDQNDERSLVIIVPDADELPEQWLPMGLVEFKGEAAWRNRFAVELAADGCDVIILQTIRRKLHQHGRAIMSRREYLHRAAFELGRTLIGYEVQSIQALIDRFQSRDRIALCGVGEGGRTALFAGAIDDRIDLVAVGSYFSQHGPLWSEPLSRQLFGFQSRFSDGHLAALIAPRYFAAFRDEEYQIELPGAGGAPASWDSRIDSRLDSEFDRLRRTDERLKLGSRWRYHARDFDLREVLAKRWPNLPKRGKAERLPKWKRPINAMESLAAAEQRCDRMFDNFDAYNQALLAESPYERRDYLNIDHIRENKSDRSNHVDTSSAPAYEASIERFRNDFRENVIGWYDDERAPLNARSTPAMKGKDWTGHHVLLDVFPDVFAYGILLMPNKIPDGKRHPVVVCQHGLEGQPQDTIEGDHRAYHDFAAKLAEQGYIVFAPQNPYIGKDAFRTLQRKSYPLGKTLFSIVGAQHEQIIRYLKTLPSVDPERIAFYGLSYGGKSAMRLPALLPDYCLSICSADFNDWVWKNASSRSRYSYIGTGEYEIFEFGLGKKFNYAEMAALIAPRPFMVERGHFDGVAPDHRVASEFAKVRFLYQARLKLEDRCEIEFFDGPHTINGHGTFRFLREHLGFKKTDQAE